jgi:hypothetical protein
MGKQSKMGAVKTSSFTVLCFVIAIITGSVYFEAYLACASKRVDDLGN